MKKKGHTFGDYQKMTHKIERRPHLANSYLPHSRLQGLGLYRRNRTKSCHPWRKKSSSSWRMGFYQIGAGSIQIYHLKGEELQLKLKMPVDGSTKIQVISRNFSCFFFKFLRPETTYRSDCSPSFSGGPKPVEIPRIDSRNSISSSFKEISQISRSNFFSVYIIRFSRSRAFE